MRHIDEELLEQYALGSIPEEQCVALEEHLLICAECQDRLAHMDAYVEGMRGASRRLRVEPERQRWYAGFFGGGKLVWALGVALAVLLLTGVQWQWSQRHLQTPAVVALVAVRGAADVAPAPAARPLALTLDATGISDFQSYRFEVVTASGDSVTSGSVPLRNGRLEVRVDALQAGHYFVRLYSPAGALLREFSLPVGAR